MPATPLRIAAGLQNNKGLGNLERGESASIIFLETLGGSATSGRLESLKPFEMFEIPEVGRHCEIVVRKAQINRTGARIAEQASRNWIYMHL
jgi:hypothetical protein